MTKFKRLFWILGIGAALICGCADMRIKTYDVRCPKCGTTFSVDEEMHLRSLGFGSH